MPKDLAESGMRDELIASLRGEVDLTFEAARAVLRVDNEVKRL